MDSLIFFLENNYRSSKTYTRARDIYLLLKTGRARSISMETFANILDSKHGNDASSPSVHASIAIDYHCATRVSRRSTRGIDVKDRSHADGGGTCSVFTRRSLLQ